MRVIGAVFILLSTTLYGAVRARALSVRVRKLERVKMVITALCEEIRLTRAELPDALRRIGRGEEYIENGAWRGTDGLKAEDLRLLDSFLCSLGKTDVEGQVNNAKLHITALDEKLTDAKEEKRKLSRLYVSLGFLCGMFAVVLVI